MKMKHDAVVLNHVHSFAHDPGGDAAVDFGDTIGHREEFGDYADIDVAEVPDVDNYCDEVYGGCYDFIDCLNDDNCFYDFYPESD